MKVSAIITAGGISKRYGSNKLLEPLNKDFTVIQATVQKFFEICDEIVIPCHQEVRQNILKKFDSQKIKFAPFGKTRQESVFNAIKICANPDYVLIHDGARPFVDANIIKNTIALVIEKKAVVVGNFAIDTIKICDENNKIINTIDRKTVFCAHTPQAFEYKMIFDIHHRLHSSDVEFTDDSSMAEYLGIDVYALEGNKENKKITVKEDLHPFYF